LKAQAQIKELTERVAKTNARAAVGYAVTGPAITLTNSVDGAAYSVIIGDGDKTQAKVEDLGERVIEGVKAKGRRESHAIPVGDIGNDRPIEVSSETWYSDELHTVVYSKRTDPRVGETELRLTNISRADQPINLFEVPAGYTMKEEGRRRE